MLALRAKSIQCECEPPKFITVQFSVRSVGDWSPLLSSSKLFASACMMWASRPGRPSLQTNLVSPRPSGPHVIIIQFTSFILCVGPFYTCYIDRRGQELTMSLHDVVGSFELYHIWSFITAQRQQNCWLPPPTTTTFFYVRWEVWVTVDTRLMCWCKSNLIQ